MYIVKQWKQGKLIKTTHPHQNPFKSYQKDGYKLVEKLGVNHLIMKKTVKTFVNDELDTATDYTVEIKPR